MTALNISYAISFLGALTDIPLPVTPANIPLTPTTLLTDGSPGDPGTGIPQTVGIENINAYYVIADMGQVIPPNYFSGDTITGSITLSFSSLSSPTSSSSLEVDEYYSLDGVHWTHAGHGVTGPFASSPTTLSFIAFPIVNASSYRYVQFVLQTYGTSFYTALYTFYDISLLVNGTDILRNGVPQSSSSSGSPRSSSSGSGGTPPMSSSSSSSGYPYPVTPTSGGRRCVRLMHPSSRTVEQISGSALSITVSMPFDIMNRYVAQMPNLGPDTLIVNYTDYQGQTGQFSRKVTFWMSDSGYVFLSQDQATQFLVAGTNGAFFDANAQNINNRNVSAGSVPLLPCENASRYDCPVLLPNQVRPQVWYRDGVLEATGGSGTAGSDEITIMDPTANP